MKDHEIAKFVNELTKQANAFQGYQSMRVALSSVVHKHVVFPECKWITEEGEDYYDTECGNAWMFSAGDIVNNGVVYCPYCGKRVKDKSDE